MSMSTHAVGVVPVDEKWKKMKSVWDNCKELGVDIPEGVNEYFMGVYSESDIEMEMSIKTNEWNDEYRQGIEVVVKDIPKNVTKIRFYNSW